MMGPGRREDKQHELTLFHIISSGIFTIYVYLYSIYITSGTSTVCSIGYFILEQYAVF
jgi:hypothetical protein